MSRRRLYYTCRLHVCTMHWILFDLGAKLWLVYERALAGDGINVLLRPWMHGSIEWVIADWASVLFDYSLLTTMCIQPQHPLVGYHLRSLNTTRGAQSRVDHHTFELDNLLRAICVCLKRKSFSSRLRCVDSVRLPLLLDYITELFRMQLVKWQRRKIWTCFWSSKLDLL